MWNISSSHIPTLYYNQYPVHSKVNPYKEAQKLIDTYPISYWNIFLGVGLGYHIDYLYQKLSEQIQDFYFILVFTSHKEQEIFFNFLPHYKQNQYIIPIIIGEYKKLETILQTFFKDTSFIDRPNIIEYFPIMKLFPEAFLEWKTQYDLLLSYGIQSFGTQLTFNTLWVKNFLINLQEYKVKQTNIQLSGDIILVSAGFSVRQNLDYLKSQKGKVPIAVVDTALPPVFQAGIIPDIIIACDGQLDNYYDFLCLLEDFDILKKHQVLLLADITVHPKISSLFDYIYFNFSEDMIIYWRKYFFSSIEHKILPAGGSVASFALACLYNLGASRIMLIGQDLQNRPLSHSVETIHHKKNLFQGNRFYPFFNTLKKWLSYAPNNLAQDSMLYHLTQWIGDFFTLFQLQGLHKDPNVPIKELSIFNNELLSGDLKVNPSIKDYEIILSPLIRELSIWINNLLKIKNYKEWITEEQNMTEIQKQMLEELLIKINIYRTRNQGFNEDIFLYKAQKALRKIQKCIYTES